MKLSVYFFSVLASLIILSCNPFKAKTDLSKENIIPKPVSITPSGGEFVITSKTEIRSDTEVEVMTIAQYLTDQLNHDTGFDLKLITRHDETASGYIVVELTQADSQLGDEGYELSITEEHIKLLAHKPAGLFRGMQTLRQLLPLTDDSTTGRIESFKIPTGIIRDYPTYAWRGSMLDVARHFFSVEDVKRYIDLISYYKMNVLHLHLSDDQGWRIEIKSWPNLTAHGGTTQVGGGKGGFYTQEQYVDIVNYAQSRYIMIVPEIDLPGHINSALASYGELNGGTIVPVEGRVKQSSQPGILNSKTQPTELYTGIEVGWSTLRVEKEITFKFVDDVLRELAALTPGPYLHIGGDEASVTKKEDYIIFINRFQKIIHKHGKRMVGWEEISQGNINSEVIVQHWSAAKYAQLAVEKGSKLIMSPAKKAYLDMQYDSATKLGLHWAAYIELDSAYLWDPAIFIEGVSKENILGVEAPLWSETISTMDEIEYLAFPRLCGIAEIGWSPAASRSWDDYKLRLAGHGPRMKAMSIDFYKSPLIPWTEQTLY